MPINQSLGGEKPSFSKGLRLMFEQTPFVYDPNGTPIIGADVDQYFPVNHIKNRKSVKVQGDNAPRLSVLQRARTEVPGLGIYPDYLQIFKWLLLTFELYGKTTANGVDVYEFRKPRRGIPKTATATIEAGTEALADRATGAAVQEFQLSSGAESDPSMTVSLVAAEATRGVAMTGAIARSAILQITGVNVTGDGVFAYKVGSAAPANVTHSPGDTTAQSVTKLAAAGITATVAGVVNAPGKVNIAVAGSGVAYNGTGGTNAALAFDNDATTSAGVAAGGYIGWTFNAATAINAVRITKNDDPPIGQSINCKLFGSVLGDFSDAVLVADFTSAAAAVTLAAGTIRAFANTTAYKAYRLQNIEGAQITLKSLELMADGTGGGAFTITATAPANTPITISKVNGAGWTGSVSQTGSNGIVSVLPAFPFAASDWIMNRAATVAAVDSAAATLLGCVKYAFKVANCVMPRSTANGTRTHSVVKKGTYDVTLDVTIDDDTTSTGTGQMDAIIAEADQQANDCAKASWWQMYSMADASHWIKIQSWMHVKSDLNASDDAEVNVYAVQLEENNYSPEAYSTRIFLAAPTGTFDI